MAQLALFTKLRVYYNGRLIFREADVKLQSHSGLIPTFDVNTGLAGFTQGAGFVTADVTAIVPGYGPDILTEADQQSAAVVTLTLLTNTGSSFTTDGSILNSEIMHGTNQETKYSFSFQGEPSSWLVVSS